MLTHITTIATVLLVGIILGGAYLFVGPAIQQFTDAANAVGGAA